MRTMSEEGFLGWMGGAIVSIALGIGLWVWGANVSDVHDVAWSSSSVTAATEDALGTP